jgi:hypothetical protein
VSSPDEADREPGRQQNRDPIEPVSLFEIE